MTLEASTASNHRTAPPPQKPQAAAKAENKAP